MTESPELNTSDDNLVACVFCTKIIPLKGNKRLPNFWLKVSIFCEAVDLPKESFENGFKFSPFCPDCSETIVAVASIQKSIDELEVKLDLYKEQITESLKLQYPYERAEETKINAFKHFSPLKFRERIREQFRINSKTSSSPELDPISLLSNFVQTVYSPCASPTNILIDNGDNFPPTEFSPYELEPTLVEEKPGEDDQNKISSCSSRSKRKRPREVKVPKLPLKIKIKPTAKNAKKIRLQEGRRKLAPKKQKTASNKKGKQNESTVKPEGTTKNSTVIKKESANDYTDNSINLGVMLEEKNDSTIPEETDPLNEERKCSGGRKYCNPKLVVKCTHEDPEKGPCNRKFETEEKMTMHIRRYHLKIPKNDLIQCPQCPRTVSTPTRLAEHMKLHTGETDIPCPTCGMQFRTDYQITKHKVRAHGEPFPFLCTFCDGGFFTNAELKYHSYSHTGQWPYPCDECDAGFPSKARLERHKQYNHYDALYVCNLCGRKYQSAAILRKHEKSHEIGKRFKCDTCGWSFRFQSALKSHIHSVHTDNRPFLCQECGAAFKLNKHLLVHLKGHDHRKRPFLKRNRKIATPSSTDTTSAPSFD